MLNNVQARDKITFLTLDSRQGWAEGLIAVEPSIPLPLPNYGNLPSNLSLPKDLGGFELGGSVPPHLLCLANIFSKIAFLIAFALCGGMISCSSL